MTDEIGNPLSRRDLRERALLDGWHAALKTLPEAQRAKGPALIIAATGNQKEQLLALHGVLHRYAAQGGPEINPGNVDQFINTDYRLGNIDATLFMQMAIGVMGSYRFGGASNQFAPSKRSQDSFHHAANGRATQKSAPSAWW